MAIQDPHQVEMERRLLLAMVLSMAALFLAPYLYHKLYPPPPQREETRQVEEPAPAEIPPRVPAAPLETTGIAYTTASPRIIEVENEDLILRWNNVNGILESAQLKHYRSLDGNLLEIIPQQVPDSAQRTLAVRVDEEEVDKRLAHAVYEIRGIMGDRARAPAEITFYYQDAIVEVTRKIHIPETGYLLEIETEVLSGKRSIPFAIVLGAGIGEVNSPPQGDFASPQVAFYKANSVTRYSVDDLEEGPAEIDTGARWVALDSKFFTYLILNPDGIRGGRMLRTEFFEESEEMESEKGPAVPLVSAAVSLERGARYFVFIGPKDYEVLEEADKTLSGLIDYGWFGFLVKPLLFGLKFVYGYVHNYGWAIIILTFVINVALFPVRYKQMSSMKKMSELQPQMKTIQEKYKKMKRSDPRKQKMNEEVMALYKRHGVNPLGGCLPLVIQMPFLFAFYRMLYSSIELRGAPFIGWIQDLSQADPLYVTPILMGVSMVVQQKMTPAAGDPTQRKMMMMLPVVFTFFFLNFSSGLVLYFLFSNLFGMMLQVLLQKWNREVASAGSAKKPSRKRKK
ncbi:membrane protein insertase YidC [Acidobacteria bacterium AH-259-O06]|nr:membrane protein insertase YidC [Acidobacteria bacterium AH-259-O06]